MRKPPFPAVVRTCPQASAVVHRGDKRRPEKKPPAFPPPLPGGAVFDPVPIDVRRQRVRNGSKRKRDLIAVAEADAAERRERLGRVSATAESRSAWDTARAAIRAAVPVATFALWIEPVTLIGAQGDTLHLDAPPEQRSWIERRYSNLIAEEVSRCSEYRRISFAGVAS